MATSQCSWRLSSILFDSSEPAIVLPTGFVLEKLQDEDGWIAITEPASLRKPSSCFHCAGTFSMLCARATRRLFRLPMKKNNAVNNYCFFYSRAAIQE